jgi:3-dehydroquinate synthetase/shikimate kinase
MDVVLVGLSGSGKSVIGRRLAHRLGVEFVDLDATIERTAGLPIPDLFAERGEDAFRELERAAIEALGPADGSAPVRRVVSTGGGAVVDPRNRWRLYRGRLAIWIDARPEVLAQRLRSGRTVRPLVARTSDPVGTMRALAAAREPFYSPAVRVHGMAEVGSVLDQVRRTVAAGRPAGGTGLLRVESKLGRITIGEGIAASAVAEALDRLDARRAVLVSEPRAWAAVGRSLAERLRSDGRVVDQVMLPAGEPAKRLAVIEAAAGELAGLRVDRGVPIVAIGGGALGDAAGFLAATWLRGVPLVHVPTTRVAQIDSSIGGKTAVDLVAGKNLVGAFHQPVAVAIDVALLRSLTERQLRAALGEAVKMAALGDERLFALLERDGPAIAAGRIDAHETGAVAELVERCVTAKLAIVLADEREHGGTGGGPGRLALNLGHSIGHAVEAAAGYRDLLHGEAVAWGLRAATVIGRAMGVTPADRADRIGRLLDRLELATGRLALDRTAVLDALGSDKKHVDGELRWVLPTSTAVEVRTDVPPAAISAALDAILVDGHAATAPGPVSEARR